MKAMMIFFLLLQSFACRNTDFPEWLLNNPHAISPDGKAALYIHTADSGRISVASWVHTDMATGGAGIFDLICPSNKEINLRWISDSLAEITYPRDARVIRQEFNSFFGGRSFQLRYTTKD